MPIFEIDGKLWLLETKHQAYAIGFTEKGFLVNTYWGERLDNIRNYPLPRDHFASDSFDSEFETLPEEFPVLNGMKFVEPCLITRFFDGTRDLELDFEKFELDPQANFLRIYLSDSVYHFRVVLNFRVYEHEDIIEKWIEIENMDGVNDAIVKRIFSGNFCLGGEHDYRIIHTWGKWFNEMNISDDSLIHGKVVLESRRLTTSHHHNPSVIFYPNKICESHGEAYAISLGWSGNWKLVAEKNSLEKTRVTVGINDWDFELVLKPQQTFQTPPIYFSWTDQGIRAISHTFHNFIQSHLLPHPNKPRKVLYNSWEATFFNVNLVEQKKLAEMAAGVGVELFVVDDGWFHGRNSDQAGLGDWWPDAKKFPNGLQPLSDFVHQLGMDFGLWIEPEMVNPDSNLYRLHPDWVLHFDKRKQTLARNQCILNMAIPGVQEYLFEKIASLIEDNDIQFIKWDMNRNVSEPGWDREDGGSSCEIWVRYVEGVYSLWQRLAMAFPRVLWQTCSGGGGRIDTGIFRYADQAWLSDNTDPLKRIFIQEGYSLFYPALTMESWVTESGYENTPLDFRFLVSMSGVLGIGSNLLHWSDTEMKIAKKWIHVYKEHREIIQFGRQYRLISPRESEVSAIAYQNDDCSKGVLFVYNRKMESESQTVIIYPLMLERNKVYQFDGLENRQSGADWMQNGVPLVLSGFSALFVPYNML